MDKTKKSILDIKLIACIIINFLKIREIIRSKTSEGLMDKVYFVKNIAKLTYDILTFNVISMAFNIIPIYRKLKVFNIFKSSKV